MQTPWPACTSMESETISIGNQPRSTMYKYNCRRRVSAEAKAGLLDDIKNGEGGGGGRVGRSIYLAIVSTT